MNNILQEVFDGILDGKGRLVQQKIQEAIDAGVSVETIVNDGMIAAMAEVGQLFEKGEYYVPEMLQSARAMQSGMTYLKPYLQQADLKSAGKVVIGTVSGDLHDIGKNLVAVMLEGAGFQMVDLGTDVGPECFVQAVREQKPDILAMSALLTTTMPGMKAVIDALEEAGIRHQVKVLIGGAPINREFAERIGADGYAPDASRAVSTAKSLVG